MKVWLPAMRVGSGVDVFTERLAIGLRSAGVEAEVTWFDRRFEFLPELMRFAAAPAGTDLIHANSWNAHVWLGMGRPVVATVHHLVHDPAYAPYRSQAQAIYHRWHVRWRELRAILGADAVTAVSGYVARTVRSISGRADVSIISNWVDTSIYKPAMAFRPWDGSRPIRILIVGNLGRRKGADLLAPLATLLGKGFELRCTGGLRGYPQAAMKQAALYFLGRLTDEELVSEYQRCDVVLSLSRYEGFGYTALEGMACGKPFIGFRAGGLTDVVTEDVGFLCEVDDLPGLVEACNKLREDCSLLVRMGERALDRARTAFSCSESISQYVHLYEEVVANAGTRS